MKFARRPFCLFFLTHSPYIFLAAIMDFHRAGHFKRRAGDKLGRFIRSLPLAIKRCTPNLHICTAAVVKSISFSATSRIIYLSRSPKQFWLKNLTKTLMREEFSLFKIWILWRLSLFASIKCLIFSLEK
jgi:hypothetical protein